MPHRVHLEQRPAGFAAASSKDGGTLPIIYREFTSSEDGEKFISRLDGTPAKILTLLEPIHDIRASTVDHLIALIQQDGTTDVYINEAKFLGKARLLKSVEQGDPILDTDIVDIEELWIDGVDFPKDVGIVFLFSQGWRKGLFFDFGPLLPEPVLRQYEVPKLFANLFNYLTFQQYFRLSEEDWNGLFSTSWFPFIGLGKDALRDLLTRVREGWDPDELVESIAKRIKERLPAQPQLWRSYEALAPHAELLDHATDRFVHGDSMSAVSILFPRIEGMLRELQANLGKGTFRQSDLAGAPHATHTLWSSANSRLLPLRFKEYLENVYFASFTPGVTPSLSRNSVAHGVAPASLYSVKSATIAFLVVEQLCYHLPPNKHTTSSPPSEA
jgi:hypothetical protein